MNENKIVKKVNTTAMTLTAYNRKQYTNKIYISNKNTFIIYAVKL